MTLHKQNHLNNQIALFIIEKAMQKQTTTYQEIAIKFGLPDSGNQMGVVLSPVLRDIFFWSTNNDMPPLTAIVVRKSGQDKGQPGEGFWACLKQVWNHPSEQPTLTRVEKLIDIYKHILTTIETMPQSVGCIDDVLRPMKEIDKRHRKDVRAVRKDVTEYLHRRVFDAFQVPVL